MIRTATSADADIARLLRQLGYDSTVESIPARLASLERRATSHGCARLSVTSAEHRADAHAFYPRCGFPYSGRRFAKRLEVDTRDADPSSLRSSS